MQLTTQVLARNTLNKHVVLSSDAKGSEFIEWAAAGDPSGNDMQIVPETIAQSAPFMRLITKGIVVIDADQNDPAVQDYFDKQRATWEARNSRQAQASADSIERPQSNDVVSLPCIGPDSRGQGQCGNDVPVREKTKDDKPPLCPMHVGMAPQYVQEERQDNGGPVYKTWMRAHIGAREVQHS